MINQSKTKTWGGSGAEERRDGGSWVGGVGGGGGYEGERDGGRGEFASVIKSTSFKRLSMCCRLPPAPTSQVSVY